MGTESEALRWKQWIDRWIKISSPETLNFHPPPPPPPSSHSSYQASASKTELSGGGSRKSHLTPEQLQYQLINMVKEGDPIFCEGLCRELLNNVAHLRLALKCLSAVDTSECPSPSVRKFLNALLPALLFNHMLLFAEGEDDSSASSASPAPTISNLNSIEISLLALYQADLNYQPEPENIRVPSLQNPSIFHGGFRAADHFPFNVNPSLIHPPLQLYPTVSVNKITDYTRYIVYYRLCRVYQDLIPVLPEISIILYCLFVERTVSGGTKVEDLPSLESFFLRQMSTSTTPSLTQSSTSYSASSSTLSSLNGSSSNLAALRYMDSEDWKFLKSLVSQATLRQIRSPPHADLYLLWTECVIFCEPKNGLLGDFLKKQILNRARSELLSQVVLALE